MVRHTLVVKPDVSNRELLNRAKEIAPEAVEGLSLRQFHGKFRLPIVRFEMTPKQRANRNGATAKGEAGAGEAEGSAVKPAAQEPTRKKSAPASSRKRGRRKERDGLVAIDGKVRKVLIEFAVELEKAESRSQLVSVVGSVDEYVTRIVSVASEAWSGGSPAKSAG